MTDDTPDVGEKIADDAEVGPYTVQTGVDFTLVLRTKAGGVMFYGPTAEAHAWLEENQ